MSQNSSIPPVCIPPVCVPAEKLVRDIRRARRKRHSAEGKIRIILEGPIFEERIENRGKYGSESCAFSVSTAAALPLCSVAMHKLLIRFASQRLI